MNFRRKFNIFNSAIVIIGSLIGGFIGIIGSYFINSDDPLWSTSLSLGIAFLSLSLASLAFLSADKDTAAVKDSLTKIISDLDDIKVTINRLDEASNLEEHRAIVKESTQNEKLDFIKKQLNSCERELKTYPKRQINIRLFSFFNDSKKE